MRNPVRLKNFKARFLPLYMIGLVILATYSPDARSFGFAAPLWIAGALLRGWGAGHLVKNDDLTTTGPYAYLRHPLYLGTILIGTGFAIAIGGFLSVLALLAFWPWFAGYYFPRKEEVESSRLASRYGERFDRYRTAVPALWPRWTAWSDASSSTPESDEAPASGDSNWRLDRYSDNNELGTLLAVMIGGVFFGLRAFGWAA